MGWSEGDVIFFEKIIVYERDVYKTYRVADSRFRKILASLFKIRIECLVFSSFGKSHKQLFIWLGFPIFEFHKFIVSLLKISSVVERDLPNKDYKHESFSWNYSRNMSVRISLTAFLWQHCRLMSLQNKYFFLLNKFYCWRITRFIWRIYFLAVHQGFEKLLIFT